MSLDREALFKDWPGCSDGYCVVRGRAKGMHTNGGCRCLVNASRGQLQILQARLIKAFSEAEAKEQSK